MNNRSIIEGGLAAFFMSILFGFLIVFISGAAPTELLSVILIVINWIFLIGGGWWAASRAKEKRLWHGALAGMVYLNVSLPMNILVGNQAEMSIPVVITSILNSTFFGALGGFIAERRK